MKRVAVSVIAMLVAGICTAGEGPVAANFDADVTQGALRIAQKDGTVVECPLKHTDVAATVSGFIARVKVTQTFYNPSKEENIEAVYVFPLPHGSAVDDMTMVIGNRRIVGIIRKRDEARSIYEQAISRGQTAALLEQERTNVFKQSVGNIKPGQEINIEISYLDVLEYDMGEYTFRFPMVVGPRYNPAGFTDGIGAAPRDKPGASAQKTEVPYLKPGERNGHDVSLSLALDAGVPVQGMKSTNHAAAIQPDGPSKASVKLSPADSIPNKDFVLKYKVAGDKPELAVLAHSPGDDSDGYFLMMVQPKFDAQAMQAPPREICFLIDVSGSMMGQPIEKVRQTMREFFRLSKPADTIQVVTFASQAAELFPRYVPATPENVERALSFTNAIDGGGGTEMLKGIKKVVDAPLDPARRRIVVMLSDGYIGNENQIIDEVKKKCGDSIRFWTIGIGASPNMMLIDGVAKQGGGRGTVLGLSDSPAELVPQIVERIHKVALSDVKIDWGRLPVFDIYPSAVKELWADEPLVLVGRYFGRGDATVQLSGRAEGKPAAYDVKVSLPAKRPLHSVLAQVWARRRIEDLSSQMYGGDVPELVEEITNVALTYRLMSQYTSFVAVDEKDKETLATPPVPPRRVVVPVPLPDGVSFDGVFGKQGKLGGREQKDMPPDVEAVYDADGPLSPVKEVLAFNDRVRSDRLVLAAPPEKSEKTESLLSKVVAAKSMPQVRSFPARTPAPRRTSERDRLDALRERIGTVDSSGYAWGDSEEDQTFAPEPLVETIKRLVAPGTWEEGPTEDLKIAAGGTSGISIAFNDTPLKDVLASLGKAVKQKITIDPEAKAKGDEKTTVHLDEMTLPSALEYILVPMGCRYEVRPDGIIVTLGDLGRAEALCTEAAAAADAGKLLEAIAMYKQAGILAAPARYGHKLAAMAFDAVPRLRRRYADEQAKKLPALNKKLNLVIRRQPLDKALAEVAKAAGIQISIARGSSADARELLNLDTLEVTYLDLRNATVAQALDWLLEQFQMEWQIAGEKATAGTSKRLLQSVPTPWSYSIAYIAAPTKNELTQDDQANRKLHADSQREIRDAVASMAGQGKVKLLGNAALLVYGTAADHLAAEAAIRLLQNGEATETTPPALAELAKKTAPRYAEHAEKRAAGVAAKGRQAVICAIDDFTWKILADALDGKTNTEALTWLQFAVNSPHYARAAAKLQPAAISRTLWCITEAARLLPKNRELAQLAEKAASLAESAAKQATEGSKKNVRNQIEALQFALASRNLAALGIKSKTFGGSFEQSLGDLLGRTFPEMPEFPALAAALLKAEKTADRAAFAKIAAEKIAGDDLVALYSVACRRLGGDTYDAFRRVRPEIISRQALSGDVILIANRLSNPRMQF